MKSIEGLLSACQLLLRLDDGACRFASTTRLQQVTGIGWRRNALSHSFCSYRLAITGDIPLVSIESGNSVQMIKRCYWDVKHFDEGLRWFGLTLRIPVERRQEPFLMPLNVVWERSISQTQISRSATRSKSSLRLLKPAPSNYFVGSLPPLIQFRIVLVETFRYPAAPFTVRDSSPSARSSRPGRCSKR
jgi:hypothetical protein